jgi:hypothetical protein
MEMLREYIYEIVNVQGKFYVVAKALSRTNESTLSKLYTGGDEEEDRVVVAVNVVGTVNSSMLSEPMMSELLRA